MYKTINSWLHVAVLTIVSIWTPNCMATDVRFPVQIKGPDTDVKSENYVYIDVTITNRTGVVGLLPRTRPAELVMGSDLDVRDANGNAPPETAFLKLRKGEPLAPGEKHPEMVGSYGALAPGPGESLTVPIDLAGLFKLSPGRYTVQVVRPDMARGTLPRGWNLPSSGAKVITADPGPHRPPPPEVESSEIVRSNIAL